MKHIKPNIRLNPKGKLKEKELIPSPAFLCGQREGIAYEVTGWPNLHRCTTSDDNPLSSAHRLPERTG